MNLPNAIEYLVDLMVQGEWKIKESADLQRLRGGGYMPDADVVIPYQWMLCAQGYPDARAALRKGSVDMRQALKGLEAFLDSIDAAAAEAQAAGRPEWAPLIAVLKAPFELVKPEVYDPSAPYCIIVMLRDTLYGGDWEKMATWIETQGGPEQQREDLPLIHSLWEFETRYGVNLTELLFSELDQQEHEIIRQSSPPPGREGRRAPRVRRRRKKKRRKEEAA